MKVEFELTPDDYVAFTMLHHRRSPTMRRQKYGCFLGGLLLLSALPVMMLLTTDEPILKTAKDIWPLLVGPLLFLLLFYPLLRWRQAAITRRLITEGKSSNLFGHCSLTINEEGLEGVGSSRQSRCAWSAVEKVLTTDAHAFIYFSGIQAYIVPRRAFPTGEAFDAFVAECCRRSGVTAERV